MSNHKGRNGDLEDGEVGGASPEEGEVVMMGKDEEGQVVEYDGSIKSTSRMTPRNSDIDMSERQKAKMKNNNIAGSGGAGLTGQPPHPHQALIHRPTPYGIPINTETTGHFPAIGSTLGPFFCLGQLGKGTFSSIHKCINLAYSDSTSSSSAKQPLFTEAAPSQSDQKNKPPRLVAAKVELTTFQQSGVLESEATILDFLHRALPPNTVPVYMGHYRSTLRTSLVGGPALSAASTASAHSATNTAAPPPPGAELAKEEAAAASAVHVASAIGGGAQPKQMQTNGAANTSATPTPGAPNNAVAAALVMEYLPGQDMHMLREKVMAGRTSRRIALEDAVIFTADVMLPLLRRMHEVGIVHRDVKPSNVVLRSSSKSQSGTPDFCLVDFGLSKSIVVPEDSNTADREHYFEGKDWLKPKNYAGRACYRKERERAEFRGTSMYASLRVHQLRDYCARDDMYSLLYVFCDLVSGGLPWMSYAAARDRDMCQTLKERVHGDTTASGEHETELLLMGDEYHVARYRRERQEAASAAAAGASGDVGSSSSNFRPIHVPQPLSLSQDKRRVALLKKAFDHLGGLSFWDVPDYDLIQSCIRGFRPLPSISDQYRLAPVPRVDWNIEKKLSERWRSNLLGANRFMPRGSIPEDTDPLDEDIFDEVEESASSTYEKDEKDDFAILPVELRFRLAQMEYHASRPSSAPPEIALRDWIKITLPLLYGEWDTPKYEGRHRTSSDGFKRNLYLRLLKRCRDWAKRFGDFQCLDYHGVAQSMLSRSDWGLGTAANSGNPPSMDPRKPKRRKTVGDSSGFGNGCTKRGSCAVVSRALFGLRQAITDEEVKRPAALAASRLSFS